MSDFSNNIRNTSNKKILLNNISSLQNNYYKEDKNIGKNRNNNHLLLNNNKIKGLSSSKNKYKVTYSNSILEQTESNNQNKKIENRNVYNIININNKNTNSNIGSIKEINFYSNNNYKDQTNTSYNFYDKIVGKIILNNNSPDNYNSLSKIKGIKSDIVNPKIIYMPNNKTKIISYSKEKGKSKNFKNKKRGPKSIYANKRPSMPLNKNMNKKNINNLNLNLNINNLNPIKKEEKKEKSHSNKKKLSSLSKLSFNNNKHNNYIINTNSSIYNTYNNETSKKNKNNLIPISLKYKILSGKKPFKQEIKKSQSQSYFKKYKINNEFNNSCNIKKNNFKNSKSKNKSNHELSYKGIILNKKSNLSGNSANNSKNNINNSNSKKNRILCINYNKSSNHGNIIDSNNFNHFMNNLPEEYNKNSQFSEIKNYWNKLKVTYTYQEMFITLTKHYDDKRSIFNHELQNLKKIYNILNKLNSDIKKRNEIIDNIKLYNYNNLNTRNLEEMKKMLMNLRNITIEIVLNYILFFKEISYDIIRNKYDLDNIKNFNKNYLNSIKKDTQFLYFNNYFNRNFYFSNKSDPFLIHPSIKQYGYVQLPIDEDTLQKISQCRYFILTEKISEYSLCDNKANINALLFNDQDNLINNLINSGNFGNNENNSNDININSTNINTEIKNNKNISIFNSPINNEENLTKTAENVNKYAKFCYINTDSNSNQKEILENYDTNIINNNNNVNNIPDEINNNSIEVNKSDKNSENDNDKDKENSIINNSEEFNTSPIKPKLINEENTNIINTPPNIIEEMIVIPYIPSNEKSLIDLYNTYLISVPENIKLSFDINNDIYYYSNIGLYPKLILFKDNKENKNLLGICTISYNPSINPSQNFSKKILMITSISCINGQKISKILKNLIIFCEKNEILYDAIEVDLHYIKKEDGSYLLDKDLEKEIKSETKFKWVRLENDGEKRRIKYHYLQSINNINNNSNVNYINSIYLNNYVLIKFLEETGINGITSLEYSKLYFIINLIKKYYLLENSKNVSEDIENIMNNLKGLKLKKIVRILSDYSNAIQTTNTNFRDDYCMNDNYNLEYINKFMDIIDKNKSTENDIICVNFNNIITNFSNIIKAKIDNYEYNIISMNNYIIEAFNMNENNNNNNDDFIYFTKSETENISFIFYEIKISNNDLSKDENDIKTIFNKILKKILVKDSEEPIKSFKKIGIPSFVYKKENNEENSNNDFNIIKNNVLIEEENLEFCCENNSNNDIKYSFSVDLNKNMEENDEIKIIKNNFILAVLNPDLVLDYHLPSMNIFYIDKSIWKKVDNNL